MNTLSGLSCLIGRKLKGLGKQKGGMKVHMLTDIHADCAKFVKMSEARMHDKKFLQYINCLTVGCMIVFDKAYNFYLQFAKWTQEGIFFVCRLKDNAKYEVVETLFQQELSEKQAGVMKEVHTLRYTGYSLCLDALHFDYLFYIHFFFCNNLDKKHTWRKRRNINSGNIT